MRLILEAHELSELIESGHLKPDVDEAGGFLLEVISPFGVRKTLTVSTSSPPANTTIAKVVKPPTNSKETVEDWIDEWRKSWSGKRPKAMGVKDKVIDNMKEFLQLYPEYNKTHVFKARDKYFDSLKGDYTYLELADYFIKKRIPNLEGGTEIRRTLLTYCEEVKVDELYGADTIFSIYDDV